MSETAAPAPAPATATPTPEAPQTAAPVEEALPALTPAQIEKVVKGYRAKVKIDNEEREVPYEELQRNYQLRQVADRRMNDAHKEKEKISALVQQLKANPEAALRELGIDPLRFSEEQLTRHIQSLKMSPEQRAMMEREAQLAQREQAIKQQEEQRKAQEQAYLEQQEAQRLDSELTEALSAENFPKDVYSIKRVANIMRNYLVQGHQISARDAVRLAREEITQEVQQFIDNLPPEQIEKMSPRAVENLRKAMVAKATGGFPQAQPKAPTQARQEPNKPRVRKSLDKAMREWGTYSE